jgi:Alw26I/Eco31I/Esp3I family type II restriction m6 adenine DNA methyltransferase
MAASVPDEIIDLVERFERDEDVYLNSQYKEEELRIEFVNPFFQALGWDVNNTKGYAKAYKDVVHEARISIDGKTKAPDYSFRIGGQRKFFVEAKKPSVDIDRKVAPAYQLRRYAWSAKLPLSILTDFYEFAIYDTRIQPDKQDSPKRARILFMRYDEYVDRWDEIASIFSKEAIKLGSFDKYAQKEERRGVNEVDDAFLEEIERWRETLAADIARNNPELSLRELNFSVQRTIDRIVFLRICEDRSIEPYGKLKEHIGKENVYDALAQDFRQADDRYNSGLFHFTEERDRDEYPDTLTLGLTMSNDVLEEILSHLYYPESPYEFSVLSTDILGQVYEQFLGRVIMFNEERDAVVVQKPEVRKSGGVYYTPVYIVDYIVQQTVDPLLTGKDWKDVRDIRILDPACGSGSFLIGAYQHMLNWHLRHYVETDPELHSRGRPRRVYSDAMGEWQLTTNEKKRILLTNIYGVDIDRQAVEVTKLSLLLKMLEGESGESLDNQLQIFQERVLPDLSDNIKCGNSLIEHDYFDAKSYSLFSDEELYGINAFDWHVQFDEIMNDGGFDAVIANPPYDVVEKDRGEASWPHDKLREYVGYTSKYDPAVEYKLNLFRFFVVRFLQLVKEEGRCGAIMPLSLLADISTRKTRRHLLLNMDGLEADCFPQKDNPNRRVFKDAKLSTAIYVGTKRSGIPEDEASITVRVYPGNSFEDENTETEIVYEDAVVLDPENIPIPLVSSEAWAVCSRVHNHNSVKRLGDVVDYKITRGEINQSVYREYITSDSDNVPLLKGAEVGQYIHRDTMSQGKQEWLDEDAFRADGKNRSVVQQRRIATQRITGVDEKHRIVAAIIDPPHYFADSTNSIAPTSNAVYSLEYLLGILNSNFYQWRFQLTSTNNNVGTNELKGMPFRVIDFNNKDEVSIYNLLVTHVRHLMSLLGNQPHGAGHDVEIWRRQKLDVRKRIDNCVYEMYDLTGDEIAIVEER